MDRWSLHHVPSRREYLERNQIGDIGAQHVGEHRQENTVIGPSFFVLVEQLASFIQALTSLNLCQNQIGDIGAEHLAEALRKNKVTDLFLSLISRYVVFSFRHWLYSISVKIKSGKCFLASSMPTSPASASMTR